MLAGFTPILRDADHDDASDSADGPTANAATKPNSEADWVKVGAKSVDDDDQPSGAEGEEDSAHHHVQVGFSLAGVGRDNKINYCSVFCIG